MLRGLARRGSIAARAGAPSPRGSPPSAPTGASLNDIALGEVPVVDLFVILVENHRLEVRDAVRRLSLAMLAAGYPPDNDTVSALDAMEILETVLSGGA